MLALPPLGPVLLGRAAPAVAPAFAPTDIAGLQGWLKADVGTFTDAARTTAASADGDPIGGWADQSGSGAHASQATAGKRPTLKLAIQNGLPVVRGDGVDDALTLTIPTGAPRTLFVVAQKRSAPSGSSADLVAWNSASSNAQWFANSGVDATKYCFFANQAGASAVCVGTAASWNVLTFVHTDLTSATPYANGVAGTAFNPNDDYGSQTTLALFALGATGSNPGNYDIGEVLLYGALTTAQQRQVEAYLGARWGITVS